MNTTKEWLEEWVFSGGFDRNGSHDAGEYREYEQKLGDYIPAWVLNRLAWEIDNREKTNEIRGGTSND